MLKQAVGVLLLFGSLSLAGCAGSVGLNEGMNSSDELMSANTADVDVLVSDAVSNMHRYAKPSDGKLYLVTVPGSFGEKFYQSLSADGYKVEKIDGNVKKLPGNGVAVAYKCEMDKNPAFGASAHVQLSDGQRFAVVRKFNSAAGHEVVAAPVQPVADTKTVPAKKINEDAQPVAKAPAKEPAPVAKKPVAAQKSAPQKVASQPAAVAPVAVPMAKASAQPVEARSINQVRDWSLRRGGLHPQMQRWAESVGYELVWKMGNELEMETPFKYTGTFIDLLNVVFEGLHAAGHPLLVTVYEGNRIITVENK